MIYDDSIVVDRCIDCGKYSIEKNCQWIETNSQFLPVIHRYIGREFQCYRWFSCTRILHLARTSIAQTRFLSIHASNLQRRYSAMFNLSQCRCTNKHPSIFSLLSFDYFSCPRKFSRPSKAIMSLSKSVIPRRISSKSQSLVITKEIFFFLLVDRNCSLMGEHCPCEYRIQISENDEWHPLCRLARNRVRRWIVVFASMLILFA